LGTPFHDTYSLSPVGLEQSEEEYHLVPHQTNEECSIYSDIKTSNVHHHITKRHLMTLQTTRTWANAQRDGRLPNIGGALCSTPQSLADAQYWSAMQ